MARFIPLLMSERGSESLYTRETRWIAEETGEWRGRVKARFEESD